MIPVGPLSLSLDNIRRQLAACRSYQAFLGVATADEAIARTYLEALPRPAGDSYTLDELAALRPFAIVSAAMFDGLALQSESVGGVADAGHLRIALETGVPTEFREKPGDASIDMTVDLSAGAMWINNLVGQIMAELQLLGATPAPGGLLVRTIRAMFGPCREPEDDTVAVGPHYQTLLAVEWGVG